MGDWEGGVPVITGCRCPQSAVDTAKDLSLESWFLLHLNFSAMDPSALTPEVHPLLMPGVWEVWAQLVQGRMYIYVYGTKAKSVGARDKSLELLEGQAESWREAWSPHLFRQSFRCQMCCLNGLYRQTGTRFFWPH